MGCPKLDYYNYAWDAPGSVTRWNPFRWRGKFWDEETGFYYMHSRYYDPQTGRFINADDPRMLFATATMGTANGGSNLFAYALNNPIMYYDPTGYIPSLIFRGVVDFFVGLYNTVVGIVTGDEETLTQIALAPSRPGGIVFGGYFDRLRQNRQAYLQHGWGGLWVSSHYQLGHTIGQTALMFGTVGASKVVGNTIRGVHGWATRPMTQHQMKRSFKKNPQMWRLTGSEVGPATGRAYRGGMSIERFYQHRWTGQELRTHVIIGGRRPHPFHFRFPPFI
ncbi:MAG: RHS repeat-associated core domain-containing protein [Firmicutes bacterium]|nr:RHS repeat-associated core domain-containing protein [Bacillota bacterium]